MKNTLEDKIAFFAKFYGQEVAQWNKDVRSEPMKVGDYVLSTITESDNDFWYLELKSLLNISDEDAIEVIGFNECEMTKNNKDSGCFGFSPSGIFVDSLDGKGDSFRLSIRDADYLRSKGYAIPYLGIYPKTFVEWGWIKIIE